MRRVSIHAFRGEGDFVAYIYNQPERYSFNPRLPGGRRPGTGTLGDGDGTFQSTPSGGKATGEIAISRVEQPAFQSTPSGGKATRDLYGDMLKHPVSIHAFRGEGDTIRYSLPSLRDTFQSTPSGGKATGYRQPSADARK